jgi:hypothetical protein
MMVDVCSGLARPKDQSSMKDDQQRERAFIDKALIAITASLATVQRPSPNEFTKGTTVLPIDEVVNRAGAIVAGLVTIRRELRKAEQ